MARFSNKFYLDNIWPILEIDDDDNNNDQLGLIASDQFVPQWSNRGLNLNSFDLGQLCIRSWPKRDLTCGFFLSLFLRRSNVEKRSLKRKSERQTQSMDFFPTESVIDQNTNTIRSKKKKHKKHRTINDNA